MAMKQRGMPVVKMTDAAINAVPLGTGTYLITTGSRRADNLRGFMLVSNAQSASFVIQRKVKGKSVRVKLGTRGELSVNEAHDKAIEMLTEGQA